MWPRCGHRLGLGGHHQPSGNIRPRNPAMSSLRWWCSGAIGCLGAKRADSETFFRRCRIGRLPESNLHLHATGCCALPARPAPGSKGVSATWFPAVFAGDFVWGRGARGRGQRVGDLRDSLSLCGTESRSCRPCAAGAALRPGPAGLDRSTGAVRSSVRSHHFSGSQHAIPRRQDCRLFAATRAS